MYQAHWGLRDDPFRNRLDTRRFQRSAVYDEALARLHFLIEGNWRFGLILGPAGVGKSLLAAVFCDELRRQVAQVGRLNLRGVDATETPWRLAVALGLSPAASELPATIWRRISDRLVEHRYQRMPTVLVIDDLDRASASVHEQVARLLASDSAPDARLTLIGTGDASNLPRLGRLLQQVDLRIDLAPWTLEETEAYLTAALERSGCRRPVFTRAAIEKVFELAQGNPRRTNQLAEMSILAGAAAELTQIGADTIEGVEYELGIPTSI